MPTPSRRSPDGPGPGAVGAGIGLVLLMVLCCAGPALIASGALAGIGAWLGSPWVIAAAVLPALGAVALAVRRARHRAACCRPTSNDPADRDGLPDSAETSDHHPGTHR
ncbi:hypothetical protein [Kitasatospora aureofaciens]|uniref:hypothetical protein n=1 Tax=Kitasatospora aureofaciens TaxID=1894 RepID=UPI00380D9B2F